MQYSITGKLFLFFIAVAGWFALIAQLYLNLTSHIASIPELITRYFSYFTILTNLIVAVCCTSLLLFNNNNFFAKPKTLTAITVYIVIVGIIYNVILRSLWNPQGLQKIVDELLHTVIPVLFFLFWILFVPKGSLQWQNIFPWLIYPLIYLVLVLIRGTLSGFYPYPFIDVNKLGLSKTIINSLGITSIFLIISLVFIAIDRMMKRKVSIHI
jgi:hypothetical protein